MAEETVLGGVINFMTSLGFYDVILPFLLVFSLVYAILDKTAVLGKEDNKPKKNLNAMIAFVVGLLVVAVKPLVEGINKALGNIVVLMIVGVFFMATIGVFLKAGEEFTLTSKKGWWSFMMIAVFVGIVLIFLDAFRAPSGRTWLSEIFNFIGLSWTSQSVATILFLVGVGGFVYWVMKSGNSGKSSGGSSGTGGAGGTG